MDNQPRKFNKEKGKMFKKIIILSTICMFLIGGGIMGCSNSSSIKDVSNIARRASVQVELSIPVMYVTFTSPLPEKKKLSEKDVNKKIKTAVEDIEATIGEKIAELLVNKHEQWLTSHEIKGIEPIGNTYIVLNKYLPQYSKMPERVLVVYETEKKEIDSYDKKYEQDIRVFSEKANVSIPTAKSIISQLTSAGYSISKEELKEESNIKLLFFQESWNATYPRVLDWEVTISGEKDGKNLIKGYDDQGIIMIDPIPKDKTVDVIFGYHAMLSQYIPIDGKIETLEATIKRQAEMLMEVEEKEYPERDISKTTWNDLRYGIIKIEYFYMLSGGSGVFLGNMKVNKEEGGWQDYRRETHNTYKENKAVILTNAHIVEDVLNFNTYISKDKEKLWITFPAYPYVRYTSNSDRWGSPAQILMRDKKPILSWSVDAAVLVTSEIPHMEQYKAILGDSDNVEIGDEIVTVGNPMLLQKYTSYGIVSNLNYDGMNSPGFDYMFQHLNKYSYDWIKNSNFWYDCTIGVGGTSGSGVFAITGTEAGKVVALHNMGMSLVVSASTRLISERKLVEYDDSFKDRKLITEIAKENKDKYFIEDEYKEAKYTVRLDNNDDMDLKGYLSSRGYIRIAGMNGAVPINLIKNYLQERGLDPDNFGWEKVNESHWRK